MDAYKRLSRCPKCGDEHPVFMYGGGARCYRCGHWEPDVFPVNYTEADILRSINEGHYADAIKAHRTEMEEKWNQHVQTSEAIKAIKRLKAERLEKKRALEAEYKAKLQPFEDDEARYRAAWMAEDKTKTIELRKRFNQ